MASTKTKQAKAQARKREQPTVTVAAAQTRHWGWHVALWSVLAVLVWTRLLPLTVSFWHDEAFNARFYIDRGPSQIWFGQYIPNNHLLYSVLTWATTSLLGTQEAVYRLWSALPGIASIGLLSWWAWRWHTATMAVAIAVLGTLSPLHLDLSVQARGYGLGYLAVAGMVVAADRVAAAPTPRRRRPWLFALAVAGTVGVTTLPVVVLPFLGVAAVLLVRRDLRVEVALAVAAAGVASLALLAPIVGAILRASGQDFGETVGFGGGGGAATFTTPVTELLVPLARLYAPGAPNLVVQLVLVAALAAGVAVLWRRGERLLAGLGIVPVVATFLFLAVAGIQTVPRFTSYLLLPLLVLIAAAIDAALRAAGEALPPLRVGLCAVLAVVALVGGVRISTQAAERAAVPQEAYREAVAIADGTGIVRVVTNTQRGFAIGWHIYDPSIELLDAPTLQALLCDTAEPLVFIDYPLFGDEVDRTCAQARGGPGILVPQRAGGPEQWMRIFPLSP